MGFPTKKMDHTEYPKSLQDKPDHHLHFIAKDAHEAMKANPDNPNNGYYADEINYVSNELARRKKARKPSVKTEELESFSQKADKTTDLVKKGQATHAQAADAHDEAGRISLKHHQSNWFRPHSPQDPAKEQHHKDLYYHHKAHAASEVANQTNDPKDHAKAAKQHSIASTWTSNEFQAKFAKDHDAQYIHHKSKSGVKSEQTESNDPQGHYDRAEHTSTMVLHGKRNHSHAAIAHLFAKQHAEKSGDQVRAKHHAQMFAIHNAHDNSIIANNSNDPDDHLDAAISHRHVIHLHKNDPKSSETVNIHKRIADKHHASYNRAKGYPEQAESTFEQMILEASIKGDQETVKSLFREAMQLKINRRYEEKYREISSKLML